MQTMSYMWAKRAKDVDRPQDEFPKDLISRSGRIRKIKDVSRDYFVGRNKEGKLLASIPKSDKVTTVTATKLENLEKVETESVEMEMEIAPVGTVDETPKRETIKGNKSRVDVDLLQKVLTESVEEWFSFTEVVKCSKGKPYKKRKIVLPPMDESDFCFELTETKDAVKNQADGNKKIDSTLDKQSETRHSEESKKEDVALKTNKKEILKDVVIKKKDEMTIQWDKSKRIVDEVVKIEKDGCVKEDDVEIISKSSRMDERGENEKEKMTENGKNKSFRHFFALILYGDQTDREGKPKIKTPDSKQEIWSQQPKTVINTLDLETASLKELKVELGEFCKLRKDSLMFECMKGIDRSLQRGMTGSTLRKSLSAECLNVFPKSHNDRPIRSAEMPAMLPSRQIKMNLKAREGFFLLRRDIIEKYKRKAECRMKQEAQKLREKRKMEIKAKENIIDRVEHKKETWTNESDQEKTKKEEINRLVGEKVEMGLENREVELVANIGFTKAAMVMTKTQIDSEKDNKLSGMKFKKRKRFSPRSKDKFFSYVNKIKRNSGYRSSTESAESQNASYEELIPIAVESTQETRVDEERETEPKQEAEIGETKERRKSQREIKLTPKLVHMIATSHKRTRRSPSIREDAAVGVDYEYPNLLKKLVSGIGTPEVVELPSSASANESYLQSKMEANASNFDCSWEPGNLVWARFAGSPFWPSLILKDPFSDDEYTKVKHWGRLLKTFVHLQFLADSGRRAWVPELYCMSFNGLDEFEKMKSNLPKIDSFTKRNDIVYQKAFFPTKKMEKAWLNAVKEGETLLTKSKDDRITYMKIKYPLVKYAGSIANGQSLCNGSNFCESKKPLMKARKRKTRSSSWMESSDWPNSWEAVTREEASTKTNESFEWVRRRDAEDNREGDEKETPKITLKLVRSTKKEEKRRWSNSMEGMEGQLTKRTKKDVRVSPDSVSNSEGSSGNQREVESSKGGRTEQVCQVCLRMVENEKVIKCNGVCPGLFPKGAELPSLEEGTATAHKKRKRRRKFSFPHSNKWKQKLWAIFDYYNEFGGSKREGMDVQGLFALYRSLCKNKTGNRRRSAKLRKIK